jgi:hypothetical protein
MKEWIALAVFLVVLVLLSWWNGKASAKHPTFGDDQARKYRKRGGSTL